MKCVVCGVEKKSETGSRCRSCGIRSSAFTIRLPREVVSHLLVAARTVPRSRRTGGLEEAMETTRLALSWIPEQQPTAPDSPSIWKS